MTEHQQIETLMNLAESVGITIRRAPMMAGSDAHPGGALIKLKGQEILFLDPLAALPDQISVATKALRGRKELEHCFLSPEVRELLDRNDDEDSAV